jgi:hypothetical protein
MLASPDKLSRDTLALTNWTSCPLDEGMDAQAQWAFIEKVGAELGANDEARRKWRERGVPAKYHWPIMKAAIQAGVALNERFLHEPPKRAA